MLKLYCLLTLLTHFSAPIAWQGAESMPESIKNAWVCILYTAYGEVVAIGLIEVFL